MSRSKADQERILQFRHTICDKMFEFVSDPSSPLHATDPDKLQSLVRAAEHSIYQANQDSLTKYMSAAHVRLMNLDPQNPNSDGAILLFESMSTEYGMVSESKINPEPTMEDQLYLIRQRRDAVVTVKTSDIFKCPVPGCAGKVTTQLIQLRGGDEMQSLMINCTLCGKKKIIN